MGVQRDTEATRHALIEAGRDVFAEFGFGGAKVDAIAARAGVNKAMINYHFQGKSGLYQVVIESVMDHAVSRLQEHLQSVNTPEQKIRLIIRNIGYMFSQYPGHPKIMIREMISGAQHLDERIQQRFFTMMNIFKSIIKEGIASGAFKDVDPVFIHHTIISGLLFFTAATASREKFMKDREGPFPPAICPEQYALKLEKLILDHLLVHKESQA